MEHPTSVQSDDRAGGTKPNRVFIAPKMENQEAIRQWPRCAMLSSPLVRIEAGRCFNSSAIDLLARASLIG